VTTRNCSTRRRNFSHFPLREDASGTMVMGDLVLTEDEVEPVMMKLQEGGIPEFCKKL
jgi:Domain of Unknown Function (DUF1259)